MAREYEIAKSSGACRCCGRILAAGEEFVAALFDEGAEFRREDLCADCWGSRGGQLEPFSIWRSRVPCPTEPKKRSVDNQVLIDFFNRLDGNDEPAKVNFRFVLALMLMRKKLLIYECSAADEAGRDVWEMRFRHDQTPVEVVRPELDDEKIAEVAEHLGSIFEGPR